MLNIQASLIEVYSLPCMFLKTTSQRNVIFTLQMRLHGCCRHIQAGFKLRVPNPEAYPHPCITPLPPRACWGKWCRLEDLPRVLIVPLRNSSRDVVFWGQTGWLINYGICWWHRFAGNEVCRGQSPDSGLGTKRQYIKNAWRRRIRLISLQHWGTGALVIS